MLTLALFAPFVSAAEPVEVKVDGVAITTAEIDAAAAGIAIYQPEMRGMLVDRMIEIELLNAEAKRRKLGKSKADKLRLELARREVMATLAIDAYVAEHTADKDVQAWYDAHAAEFSALQVRAHHTLVETEAEADAILARVNGGEDFEAVVAATSRDPSAVQNKGDLGWFVREQMVPEFATAAFDNAVGSVVKVQTQFGWHVLRVDGRRDAVPVAEVADQIRGEMRDSLLETWLGELRSKAKVER